MKYFWMFMVLIVVAALLWYYWGGKSSAVSDTASLSGITGVDTVIDEGIYQSYFCYRLKEPLLVSYVLYHGGGHCSRAHFRFHNDTELNTATARDYSHSGYDEGHLANADDFAYDCDADEKTFRFFNCVPQTPHLNRGPWKHWETEIRKESQDDSLLVLTGSIFGNSTIGDGVYVPDYCWKVAEALSTKTVMNVVLCDNTTDAHCEEISLDVLQGKLGYRLPLRK